MIRTTGRAELPRLLLRVHVWPGLFRRVMICSPFVSPALTGLLVSVIAALDRTPTSFLILTRPEGATELVSRLPGPRTRWAARVLGVPHLHAKAYVALGRSPADTRAIVTSANLTAPGLSGNVELGVVASPSCDTGVRLITEVTAFLDRLSRQVHDQRHSKVAGRS